MNDNLQTPNDVLRLIDQHRFHNPLIPRTCYICKVETYKSENTPTVRWSKAVKTVLHPPVPVVVLLLAIAIQLITIATLLA